MLTAAQLLMRKTTLGASEIAAVADLHPYASPWDVWVSKTVEGFSLEESEAMELGNAFEAPIADLYARRNPDVTLRTSDTVRHPLYPWATATPDRLVVANDSAQVVRLLEVKWAGITSARDWGTEEDGIPDQYNAQVQWQMFVTDHRVADVAAVVAGRLRFYRVERSDPLIAHLFAKGQAFMDLLRSGGTPTMDSSGAARAWLLEQFPTAKEPKREATAEEIELVAAYDAARERESIVCEEKARLGNALRAAIGDAAGLMIPGFSVSSTKPNGRTVAWQEVAVEAGATEEQILKHSTPMARRLFVKRLKNRSRT